MPWFKKDEADLPESLKGKTQEEIEAVLARTAELETENTSLRTQIADTNSRFETFGGTIQELNNKIDAMKPPARTENNGERASFLTDPDNAFNERAAPIVNLLLSTSATLAKEEARRQAQMRQRTQKNNTDGMLFEKFDGELMDLAKTCSPQQLAAAATWTHLFYNVKGRHADEMVTNNVERKGDFFVEDVQRLPINDVPSSDKLTAQEIRIAGKMGVSPEKYLERKKEMVVGAPETI